MRYTTLAPAGEAATKPEHVTFYVVPVKSGSSFPLGMFMYRIKTRSSAVKHVLLLCV